MRRNVPAFPHAQTERLIALNRQLTQLEYWCLQHAKRLVDDLRNRPAPSDWAAAAVVMIYGSTAVSPA
jgi:hypothetical protein